MKTKDLEKLGLTAENLEKGGLDADLPDKIFALHGKATESLKEKITSLEGERDGLKDQLKTAGEAIEEFKKLDPEGIKKAADDWKTKAEQAQEAAKKAAKDADDKVAALNFDHALEGALAEAKAKNPKAVKALLKTVDLKLTEDGSIAGLKEQLEKVREENEYLFSDAETPIEIVTGGKNQPVLGDAMIQAARVGAGLVSSKEK